MKEAHPTTRIQLKVSPGASRDAIEGWMGDALKVRVKAPPERGKANAAVEALLASTLGVPKSNVEVVTGHTSSRKIVRIDGLSSEAVERLLPRTDPSD